MWNGIGWYGFIGPTTSTTDISLRKGRRAGERADVGWMREIFVVVLFLFFSQKDSEEHPFTKCSG